jgi:hypothetical protein
MIFEVIVVRSQWEALCRNKVSSIISQCVPLTETFCTMYKDYGRQKKWHPPSKKRKEKKRSSTATLAVLLLVAHLRAQRQMLDVGFSYKL